MIYIILCMFSVSPLQKHAFYNIIGIKSGKVIMPMNNKLDVYEGLLLGISAVYGAKFRTNAGGEITECHILADNTRNVKQIVRDVQSALMAKYSVDLDYKLISIAQIDQPQDLMTNIPVLDSNLGSNAKSRITIKSIQYTNLMDKVEATVVIGDEDVSFKGTSICRNSIGAYKAVFARATIDALNEYMGISNLLSIGDVKCIDMNGKKTILVSIHCVYRNVDETYVGCSIVERDENLAVVKATLGAINRRIVVLKSK